MSKNKREILKKIYETGGHPTLETTATMAGISVEQARLLAGVEGKRIKSNRRGRENWGRDKMLNSEIKSDTKLNLDVKTSSKFK